MSRPDVDAAHSQLRGERLARYRADPLARRVRWICVCDGRSCDTCVALDGAAIALDDVRWPQLLRLHDGCRCRFTLMPD